MRTLLTSLGMALTLLAMPAQGKVDVVFVAPETYLDAGLFSRVGRGEVEATLARLGAHLERLGQRHLAPGQSLTVEILDVDLAGELQWWRQGDVRVLRPVTWPRIRLRYRLLDDGATLADGEEALSDRVYLMRPSLRRGHDSLRYEKAMLDDWFQRRFGSHE